MVNLYQVRRPQAGRADHHDLLARRRSTRATRTCGTARTSGASSCMVLPDRPEPPQVVGLRREREVLTVALDAGRHVVLEGPPGTGKSTLLRHIARDLGTQVVFVEGNAELTPARLIGQYDPAQVLAEGYVAASFTDGPLLQAMRAGALLYLEEFNRVPEETLNVLITVLTEGEIAVPRLGMVKADPGFRLIAAMNPFDAIGTARVSHAIADRICRVVLGYQDAAAERRITTDQTGMDGPGGAPCGHADQVDPRAPGRPDGLVRARRDRPGAAADRPSPAARRGPARARDRPRRRARRALGADQDRRRLRPAAGGGAGRAPRRDLAASGGRTAAPRPRRRRGRGARRTGRPGKS